MQDTPKKLQKLTRLTRKLQKLPDARLTIRSPLEPQDFELSSRPTPVPHLPILSAGLHHAEKGQHYPAHYHPTLELILYRTGQIEWHGLVQNSLVQNNYGQEEIIVQTQPGMVLLTPPNVLHHERALTSYSHTYFLLDQAVFAGFFRGHAFAEVRTFFDDRNHSLEQVMVALTREWHGHNLHRERMIEHLFNQMIILPGFLETHPNVDVQVMGGLGYGDYHPALNNRLNSGTAEDVVSLGGQFVVEYAESNFFENLAAAPYNADVNNFVQSQVALATGPEGNVIAIPNDAPPAVMYYRRDVFEAAGLEITNVTSSWESYIAAGQILKEQGVFISPGATDVANLVLSSNIPDGEGVYFDKDGNVLVGNERFVRAFTLAKQIRDEGLDSQIASWTPEWFEGFKSGQVATITVGSWFEGILKTQADPEGAGRWGAALPPEKSSNIAGGAYYRISASSKNKELAWELIQYLTGREALVDIFKQSGNFPANLTVLDDPVFAEGQDFFGGEKVYEVYAEASRAQTAIPSNKNYAVANSIVQEALLSVLNDGADIQTALADAKSLIERRASR
jgi:multiple sugar transport system substrate-binding protein